MSINWHQRYRQQATWTADLRSYIFNQIGLGENARTLEIGCGTGAILETIAQPVYGLDLRLASLQEAKVNAPTSPLTCANALALPYADQSFDVVFSHFLWLWLPTPQTALAEMIRITRPRGHIIAFAEPDYTRRVDEPATLAPLGAWQRDALQAQGADVEMGAKLAALFHSAGTQIVETGTLAQSTRAAFQLEQWKTEWAVLEADLTGQISASKIQKMKTLDLAAWQAEKRLLYVPTHYLWARIRGG